MLDVSRSSRPAVRVLLADDHTLLRDGLARSLARFGCDVVAQAGDGRSAVDRAEDTAPDVALIDVSMPVMDGLAAARAIHLRHPRLPIVILSMHDDPELVREAEAAGATAYVTKDRSTDELVEVIERAVAGLRGATAAMAPVGPAISEREMEVLALLAEGDSTAEIGRKLFISQKTVKNHLSSIYQKLDARDRTQAVVLAARLGLVDLG